MTVIAVALMVVAGAAAAQSLVDVDEDGVFPGSEIPAQPAQQGTGEGVPATLLCVGWSFCPVGTVDTVTGTWTPLGNAGFDSCNSMARNAAGDYYTVGTSGAETVLITIDPATGAGSQVAVLNPELSVRAMAFSLSGVLYVVGDASPEDQLWAFDPATGNGTMVGAMGFGSVQGLAFDFLGGTLYATDNTQGLLTVDAATGAATNVNGSADGTSEVQTITVLPGGEIFGIRNDVYSIDPVTGVFTQVTFAGTFPDLRGADFVGPVPVELMGFTIE